MAFLSAMRQRLLQFEHRTNEELLNLVIQSPSKAKTISEKFDIRDLHDAHPRELDLTPKGYERLMAAIEIGRRVVDSQSTDKATKISSSTHAIDFCRNHFARLIREAKQEEFHVVTLDTKNVVINSHQVTVGTLDASLVHPREVFRRAIKDVSSSIILAHNHPSGDPTPSREDVSVTNRLEESGRLLGIDVLDHIVMARAGCISIKEHGA